MHPSISNSADYGPDSNQPRSDDPEAMIMIDNRSAIVRLSCLIAFAAAVLVSGCATDSSLLGDGTGVTASDPTRLTQSGFLSDYGRLAPVSWTQGVQCWRQPSLDAKQYDKVLIARIKVSLKPGQQEAVDPTDLKMLTDYFHASLVKALKPQMQVVDQPGPGVLALRIALTNLVPTDVTRSVAGSVVPYGFVAEAGSGVATGRPAGSTPYLGETGMEMQFVDGASGKILAECRDTEVGRKYAADLDAGAAGAAQTWANGYVSAFQGWSYAKNAFDKWSALTAQRLAALRGVGAAN